MIAYFLCQAALIKRQIQLCHIQCSELWSSINVMTGYCNKKAVRSEHAVAISDYSITFTFLQIQVVKIENATLLWQLLLNQKERSLNLWPPHNRQDCSKLKSMSLSREPSVCCSIPKRHHSLKYVATGGIFAITHSYRLHRQSVAVWCSGTDAHVNYILLHSHWEVKIQFWLIFHQLSVNIFRTLFKKHQINQSLLFQSALN